MTTYYVGSGGSDANSGTTYANRKLTINGAEDVPVAAADRAVIQPGIYRELHTADVSGSAESPIVFEGDNTGALTDGIGGRIRVTGSDDDLFSAARAQAVTVSQNYRTFRGLQFDIGSSRVFNAVNADNLIIEDCIFQGGGQSAFSPSLLLSSCVNVIVRRCIFVVTYGNGGAIRIESGSLENVNTIVENCLIMGADGAISTNNVEGVLIRHCTIVNGRYAIDVGSGSAGCVDVSYCIIAGFERALTTGTSGYIVEDYNSLWANQTARTNVSTGANSVARPPLFKMPQLYAGIRMPANPTMYELGAESDMVRKGGHASTTDDLYGMARPTTDSKKSWGAIQHQGISRDTTTVRTGGAALKIDDAGRHQEIMAVDAVSTTISVWVRWEANYAGTKPQLIVRQPGQSDQTATATGSAGSWEQLSVTFTPSAQPGWVCVEVASHNTATSGSYAVYVDDLAKS